MIEKPTPPDVYRARAAKNQRAKQMLMIDGRQVCLADLAVELGIHSGEMSRRYRRECKKPGPVTIAGLSQ